MAMEQRMSGGMIGDECAKIERPSVRDQLQRRRDSLASQLADVEAALTALDANPSVAKVLELVARASVRL